MVLFLCLLPQCVPAEKTDYCGLSPERYLTGRFLPEKMKCFVNLSVSKIPVSRKDMYIRKEAAAGLEKMMAAFHRDHPKIKLFVRSATRNFFDQRYIWQAKWSGKRKVEGKKLNRAIKDPRERALKILEFSSMPGTSRHHWGTDIDFNSLTNEYYEKGEGKIIYTWLRKNAHRFGFAQPYSPGRDAGYNEERWHWSYLPLSKAMLHDWNRLIKPFGYKKLKISFWGKEEAWSLAPIYVNAISGDCR